MRALVLCLMCGCASPTTHVLIYSPRVVTTYAPYANISARLESTFVRYREPSQVDPKQIEVDPSITTGVSNKASRAEAISEAVPW